MEEKSSDKRCWSKNGLWGDCSCTQLKDVLHCRNCKNFGNKTITDLSEKQLIDFPRIDIVENLQNEELHSYFLFKCANSFFALSPQFVGEVTPPTEVHRIPHRTGNSVEGVSNINGELVLVIDIYNTFNLPKTRGVAGLMVLCKVGNEKMAFKTDSVLGMRKIEVSKIKDVKEDSSPFICNVFSTQEASDVNVLDVELLTTAIIKRRI